jgi:hypothetical protein
MVYFEPVPVFGGDKFTGWSCELPEGEYFFGDPGKMALSKFKTEIEKIQFGVFEDFESDAIIAVESYPSSVKLFDLTHDETKLNLFFCCSSKIALMSACMVRPVREFNARKVVLTERAVLTVKNSRISLSSVTLGTVVVCPHN